MNLAHLRCGLPLTLPSPPGERSDDSEDAEYRTPSEIKVRGKGNSYAIKVLLIEDNPGDARLIREMLIKERTTSPSASGQVFELKSLDQLSTGLEHLRANKTDVVLLDPSLPDSQGLNTFAKTHAQAPKVPIIILSSLDDEMLAVKAVREGAQDYLVKGQVDSNLLVRAIHYAIERKKAERALNITRDYAENLIKSSPDMIISVDRSRHIIEFNPAAEQAFGHNKGEILGQHADCLYANPSQGLQAHASTLTDGQFTGEITNKRKDGKTFYSYLSASLLRDADGTVTGVMGVSRDITEQKKTEEQIKTSLREKEVLLREIHHRVKNNLQVISSLLHLQSRHIKDKQILKIFEECRQRIKSMALIHEELYQSKNMDRLDFAQYIRKLSAALFRSYGASSVTLRLKIDAKDISPDIDTAIACGLIINELVSNSLKYAFPQPVCLSPPAGRAGAERSGPKDRKDEISIVLRSNGNGIFTLVVSDNGVGMPKNLDFRNTTSLGLQLVCTLTEQLQGTIELATCPPACQIPSGRQPTGRRGNRGTTFKIEFGKVI